MNWKRNLWILWVTQIISLMSFGFGLPFIPLYIQELESMTPEKLKLMTTILAAAPAVTMAIMAPIWGYLADRFGRKLMIMRAMVFAVFVLGGMGLVTNVSQLVVLRLMQGLFTGTVTAAIAFVSANSPKNQLTYALGVITSSTFIGYSLGPMIGGGFAELFGYRVSFFAGSALMVIGALLVLVLVKEDKSTLVNTSDGKAEPIHTKYRKIIVPLIIVIMVMLFFLRISRTIFSPYLSLFVQNSFSSNEGVALTTGIISALVGFSTAVSSIFVSSIAHKFNKMKLISSLIFTSLIVMVLIINYELIYDFIPSNFVQPLWIFTFLYMLFYFLIGGIEPLLTSTAAMHVESENRGALFGFQGLILSMAWFVAPAISGPIVYYYDVEKVLLIVPIVILINYLLSKILKQQLV